MKLSENHTGLPLFPALLHLLLIFVVLVPVSLCAQGPVVTGTRAHGEMPDIEEIRLATDRDIYIAGEQVFFNVWQIGRLTHTPGTVSRVVYTDLIDSNKSPVVQVKTGTDGFTGAGVFRIPDTLRTGNYLVRSFTNLMKNYSQDLFSYRMITVVNPFRSFAGTKIPPSDNMADSVAYFPETGSLVAGLKGRLGIKCFNKEGDPVSARGFVVTAAADTLAAFSTDRHGTAIFELTPPDAGKLSLVMTDEAGAGRKYNMPEVQETGVTFYMSAGSSQGEVSIRLATDEDIRGKMLKVTYAPVSSAPLVKEVYAAGNIVVKFVPGSLPEGLARVSITDLQGHEMASRWYYNNSLQPVNLDVNTSSSLLTAREKERLTFRMTDGDGNPLSGIISVSVVKRGLINRSCFDGLSRDLQLPSVQVLRTDITEPGINDFLIFCEANGVFSGTSGTKGEITFLPEPEGHLVTGVVRDIETGEPLAGEDLTLSVVGRVAHCIFTRSDSDGRFSFPITEYGRKEIVIQRLNPRKEGYYVDLADPFLFPMTLSQAPGPFYPDTTMLGELNDAIISMQVRNIYDPFLAKSRVKLSDGNIARFFGEPDRSVVLSDFIQLTTLREVFKEIVPGLTTTGRDENLTLRLTNRYQGIIFNSQPLVILDGVPVYDLEKVLEIPSSQIEKVEVLSVRFFTGELVLDGIINIVSHKGDLSVLEFDRSVMRQEYEMMLDSYETVSPDYSTDSLRASRIPDYRNTLYWNPSVRAGVGGTAAVEFWTSDETGEYLVVAECIAADGRRGRKMIPFTVRH